MRSAALRNAELRELLGDGFALCRRTDLLVDVQDASVIADVERPARRKRLIFVDNAVRFRQLLGRIAQQREIDPQRLRELLVGFRGVDADGEIRNVKGANELAALTERLAFRRSPAGERFGKPREHDGALAFVVGQAIGCSVGSSK